MKVYPMSNVKICKFSFTKESSGVPPVEILQLSDLNYYAIHSNMRGGVTYHLGYALADATLSDGVVSYASKADLLTYLNSIGDLTSVSGDPVTASNEADRLWIDTILVT